MIVDEPEKWEGWERATRDYDPDPDFPPVLPPVRFQKLAEGEPVLVVLRAGEAISDEELLTFAIELRVNFRISEVPLENYQQTGDNDAQADHLSVEGQEQETDTTVVQNLPAGLESGFELANHLVIQYLPRTEYQAGTVLEFEIDPSIRRGESPQSHTFWSTRAVVNVALPFAVSNQQQRNWPPTGSVSGQLTWTENNSYRAQWAANLRYVYPEWQATPLGSRTRFVYTIRANWEEVYFTATGSFPPIV